jgi:hypothetical protein
MPYELLHFRDAEKIIKDKGMGKEVASMLSYIADVLYGSLCKAKLLREALKEMGWRENRSLTILEGRKYQYKGFKNRIALEGHFSAYEILHESMLRLQVGYDQGILDTGILLLTGLRGEKTPYGSTTELVESEIEQLYPTISMPVSIALFDVGEHGLYEE